MVFCESRLVRDHGRWVSVKPEHILRITSHELKSMPRTILIGRMIKDWERRQYDLVHFVVEDTEHRHESNSLAGWHARHVDKSQWASLARPLLDAK